MTSRIESREVLAREVLAARGIDPAEATARQVKRALRTADRALAGLGAEHAARQVKPGEAKRAEAERRAEAEHRRAGRDAATMPRGAKHAERVGSSAMLGGGLTARDIGRTAKRAQDAAHLPAASLDPVQLDRLAKLAMLANARPASHAPAGEPIKPSTAGRRTDDR